MSNAYIQLRTKNFALIGDKILINTEFIPRIGEIIDAGSILKLDNKSASTFIIESVVYKLTENGFTPYITAKEWFRGLRHELLKERMWLDPDDTEYLCYDEDDPAILD